MPTAIRTAVSNGDNEPRLRFDRVAVGLVTRLQWALARSVPQGEVVIVTVTAPIRQDSKTGRIIEAKIRDLLASRRSRIKLTVRGNRVQVRVLKGGRGRTPRLIGFVHNPAPSPELLFDVTKRVLAALQATKRSPPRDRWRGLRRGDAAPVETIVHVCRALRAQALGTRLLAAERRRK